MKMFSINFLRLLQLADSALPVGGAAQSFGIEALVADGLLTVSLLEDFLHSYIAEVGVVEAWFCRAGARLGNATVYARDIAVEWNALNAQLSALKPARESRNASLSMGRRLMLLMKDLAGLAPSQPLTLSPHHIITSSSSSSSSAHYAPTFGYCAGLMGIVADEAALALLQQSLTGLVSVCQRLLPLGQTEAMRLSWKLKKTLAQAVDESANEEMPFCCMPLVEIGSMRHANLNARMFIS